MADANLDSGGAALVALRRLPPLSGLYASGPGVTLGPIPPRKRVSLRLDAASLPAAEEALGFALPRDPKTSTSKDGIAALWLGPDEWLVLAEASLPEGQERARLGQLFQMDDAMISVVDISHRNTAIEVEGPAAEAVIAAGCPQDIRLRSFPVGAASRTVLAKAEIVLWRRSETRFEIECWRSFAEYVWAFLREASTAPAV